MKSLLLVEHNNASLNDATARALTAATQLGGEVHLLVAGHECRAVAESAAKLTGASKVLLVDAPTYAHMLPEPLAVLLNSMAATYDAFLAPSTSTGKNVMPRLAALLDVMQISDMMAVIAPDTFQRPIFAGNVIQTVRSTDAKKAITVRTTAFAPAPAGGSAEIETVAAGDDPGISSFVEEALSKSERAELTTARIVVSGGRALKSRENFAQYIESLADKIGAAVGASRAAVDAGYAPNDWQVGQTGKIVAPDLYLAIGISGAIQHLAGMKDAKVIVAINSDADAPIFQVADYGLVGDLYQVLPELSAELSKGH